MCVNLKMVSMNTLSKTPHDARFGHGSHVTTGTAKTPIDAKRLPQPVSWTLMHTQTIPNHSPISCCNPESAGSQAPGPDVRACMRRSDIPVRGGQYVLTVAIQDLASALTHRREGRTVHGHT